MHGFLPLQQALKQGQTMPLFLWGRMVDEYGQAVCLHCVVRLLEYKALDSLSFKSAELALNVTCKKLEHIFLKLL